MNPQQAIEKLKAIPADEPVFILRGRDPSAATIVGQWVYKNAEHLGWAHAKITEAELVQAHMNAWPEKKLAD